jgi:protoporphyrinogen IX oxidase
LKEASAGTDWAVIVDWLTDGYPWIKSLHVVAVISWMAGLLYLPRLFVYHAERAMPGDDLDRVFQVMEGKLYRLIMTPAMVVAWVCGLAIVAVPGVVDWGAVWPWAKLAAVVAMSGMHGWLGARRKDFAAGRNSRNGRAYRLANEVPTVLMLVIVVAVIAQPF